MRTDTSDSSELKLKCFFSLKNAVKKVLFSRKLVCSNSPIMKNTDIIETGNSTVWWSEKRSLLFIIILTLVTEYTVIDLFIK